MLEHLLSAFSTAPGLSLLGPFAVLIFCGLGLPIPEDIVLVSAGFLGAQDGTPLLLTSSVMYLGILMGDSIIYLLGRFFGPRITSSRVGKRLFSPSKLSKAREYFDKWGAWVIFVARFTPGLRAPIFFSAGTLNFSTLKFVAIDGFAAIISAPLFVYLGHKAWFLFGDNLDGLKTKMQSYQTAFFWGGLILAALLLVFCWLKAQNKNSKANLHT